MRVLLLVAGFLISLGFSTFCAIGVGYGLAMRSFLSELRSELDVERALETSGKKTVELGVYGFAGRVADRVGARARWWTCFRRRRRK